MSDRITDARTALHGILAGGEITEGRAHRYPQTGQYATPCAWVGWPLLAVGPNRTKTVTLPLVLAFDGARDKQVAKIDAEMARIADALDALKVGEQRPRLVDASTRPLGPDGASTLAVVFDVELDVLTQTLCEQTLAEQP